MAGKMFYAAAVVLLDIAAAGAIVSSITSDTTEAEFQSALEQGADLESRQLYGRAINAYSAAENIHDSIDLRLKVADLYGKGFENGEFGSLEPKTEALRSVINDYAADERVLEAYDGLAKIFTNEEEYQKLANLVKHAKSNGIDSETLSKAYEDVRQRYDIQTAGVDTIESVGPYWIGWFDVDPADPEEEVDPNENKLRSFKLFYENGESSDY
ncbi:MAG: hypothetical protein K6B74_09870, partial [Ruminococcus sp.]|nr:hypothetical protein [Ruminococcus sp.]